MGRDCKYEVNKNALRDKSRKAVLGKFSESSADKHSRGKKIINDTCEDKRNAHRCDVTSGEA